MFPLKNINLLSFERRMFYVGYTGHCVSLCIKLLRIMDMIKPSNGFYTITFINKNNLDDDYIFREFSTVGNVYKITRSYNRMFIKYRDKAEAQRALAKFEKQYHVEMAKNFTKPNEQQAETSQAKNSEVNSGPSDFHSKPAPVVSSPPKMSIKDSGFHLILGNLPQNYTIKDVTSLVVEVKPISVSDLLETKAFNVKFCHIVVDTSENLNYLINKLDGFVIGGEKLMAIEAKNLLEWRNRGIPTAAST